MGLRNGYVSDQLLRLGIVCRHKARSMDDMSAHFEPSYSGSFWFAQRRLVGRASVVMTVQGEYNSSQLYLIRTCLFIAIVGIRLDAAKRDHDGL